MAVMVWGEGVVQQYQLKDNQLTLTLSGVSLKAITIHTVSEKNMITIEIPDCHIAPNLAMTPSFSSRYLEKMECISGLFGDSTLLLYLKPQVSYQTRMDIKSGKITLIFSSVTPLVKMPTIVLDPGHGGKDPGATGVSGIQEKEVVYAIAVDTKKKLEALGYKVYLTRGADEFVSLTRRPKIAQEKSADLFISIHANATSSSTSLSRGVEVFYYSKKSSAYAQTIAAYENSVDQKFGITSSLTDLIVNDIFYQMNQGKSAELGAPMARDITFQTGEINRGLFGANFAVLRGSPVPAVLVEVGFLTHEEEGKSLGNAIYQQKIAQGITNAVDRYFEQSKEK